MTEKKPMKPIVSLAIAHSLQTLAATVGHSNCDSESEEELIRLSEQYPAAIEALELQSEVRQARRSQLERKMTEASENAETALDRARLGGSYRPARTALRMARRVFDSSREGLEWKADRFQWQLENAERALKRLKEKSHRRHSKKKELAYS